MHAYPAVVCGWKNGTPVDYACNGKTIAATTKAKIGFKWQGPNSCAGGANRANILIDTYTHDRANPQGGDMPRTSIMLQSDIDCDHFYGGHARDGQDLVVGNNTYRIFVYQSGWASGNTIEVFLGPFNADWSVGGSKDTVIDYLALLNALAARGLMSTTEYITSIQAGFELLAGGSYRVTDFWVAFDNQTEGSGATAAASAASSSSVVSSAASTATTLAAVTGVTGNLLSRSLQVTATSGTASQLSDADYSTQYRSSGTAKLCWDVTAVANKSSLYFVWWGNNTYSYDHARIGQAGYNNPGTYKMVGSSGNTFATVTGNTRKSRAHLIDATGESKVCMDVTAIDGSSGNMDVGIQADLWDASKVRGRLYVGDSNVANQFDHKGTEPAVRPYEALGWPGSKTSDWVTAVSQYVTGSPAKDVFIMLGTNNGPDAQAYENELNAIVTTVESLGFTVYLSPPLWSPDSGHTHMGALAARIPAVLAKHPAAKAGPDVYSASRAHPEWIGSDGIHLNDAGGAAVKALFEATP
ncbi:MAG: SGNH/GDSL hydrolase family protein [Steroidobacteraceae bacterium]